MPTQCSQAEMDFGSSGGRKLVGAFDGGAISSNGGAAYLNGSATILNSSFIGNYATGQAGALLSMGNADITNTQFY